MALVAILLGQFFCGPAQAHPHVWVDYSVVIQGDGTRVHALKEQWVFAKSFPVAVVIENDKVVYTFVLPLAKPIDLIRNVVELGVADEPGPQ